MCSIMTDSAEAEKTATFQRVVYKNAAKYHYMKISLEFEKDAPQIDAAFFKQLVISALKSLYGEVGAALPFDVLKFEEETLRAVLRVYSRGLVRLWSALTLVGSYRGITCAVRVHQVSPFLLALSGNSRQFHLNCDELVS